MPPATRPAAMLWYATAGHHPADVTDHRDRAPWYTTKTTPSTADMIAKLRRVLIAAKYRPPRRDQPTPAESTASGWPGNMPTHDHRRLRNSSPSVGHEMHMMGVLGPLDDRRRDRGPAEPRFRPAGTRPCPNASR
jgi:hypothetical protein